MVEPISLTLIITASISILAKIIHDKTKQKELVNDMETVLIPPSPESEDTTLPVSELTHRI